MAKVSRHGSSKKGLKRNAKEKTTIIETKNTSEEHISRLDLAGERISESEDRAIKLFQTEHQGKL